MKEKTDQAMPEDERPFQQSMLSFIASFSVPPLVGATAAEKPPLR